MKSMKRLLAMLLCVVMVVGLIPASILTVGAADGETIYVLAGGDFQQAGDHSGSAENVTNILNQIYGAGYTTMDGFIFIGDYDCETHDSSSETAAGITALMGAVQGKYSNINDANSVLTQGNHDYMDSRIDATGGHTFDGYSVYVLNEDDYPNGGGSQSGMQTLANNLKTWLNDKIGEGYSAPIFISSHLPLAFTPRTVTQGDAKYAKLLFDVLNDAADNGLNIIFLHGHDHAYGPDNYMGGEAIYLPVGHKICIAEEGSTSAWTEETLKFTYMNAGYTGYYSDPYTYVTTAGTDKLTMTVFAITDNQVTVERYSEDGLYNLKSAGYDGSYSNTSVTNLSLGLPKYEDVIASPQTIVLEEAEEYGSIGSYVGIASEVADDVTTSGSDWTEVTAPVPGTSNIDDVTTSGSNWTTITEPSGGTTTYTYTQATSITAGGKYVIVANSHEIALQGTTSMGTQSVDINGTTMTSTTALTEWTFSGSDSGTIYNGTRYLRYNNSAFSLSNSSTTFTITDNGSNFRIRSGNYSFYYNGSSWTRSSRNSAQYVRLYQLTDTTTTGGSNGLYAHLEGDLTYNFPTGTSAADALAAVKEGITIKYATAADYSDEAVYPDDGEGMDWVLDPNYDPNVPGDYAVTISYNGTVLGVAEVVVTGTDVNGEYAKLKGELSYQVELGTSADDALKAVKEGIDGYTYEGMSAPAGDAGTKLDDSELIWTLDPNYNGTVSGDYAVTITYKDKTLGVAEVIVPAATTYYVAEGNGLYLVDMNTTAANAMAAVKAGVTVYSATDAEGTNKTEISDDEVTWNWVDTYNGADSGPYTVEILKDGTSLGTVEVKVNIKYETGINSDWTYVGESEATGGSHTYTLDTDGIEYGSDNKYIIVDDNNPIALHATGTSNGTAETITISGNTATTTTRDYEYHFIQTSYNGTRYELITKGDGSQYLYQESNGVRYGTRSSVKFQVNHHGNGVYDIHDIDGTNWYIIYNGGWTVTETTSARVRLYKYTGTTGGTGGGSIYAKIEGNTIYSVAQGTSATKALAAVKEGITGYLSNNADGSNPTELDDSKLTWKWKNTYNGNSTGSYWVEISYEGKVLGTVEVRVEPGMVNNYPEYPDEGAVKVNKTATGVQFQSSGVAQVEISASGVPVKKGVDVILMLDTSSSMTSHTVTGTSKTRAEVLEESLANLITQFKTPGDDGELLDIDVAIADFNGFYGENHNESGTAYDRDAADMMSDDISYNANSEAQIYTGTKDLSEGAFIPVDDLAANYTLNYTSGTNYDYAMDAIYQLATAKKLANGGEDRDLYVIFMSDGAAMQWNYYHSQGGSSLWNNWITGAWDADDLTTANLNCTTHAYYYDEVDHNGDGMRNEHRMANAIKGDPTKTYEVIRKTATLGTSTGETNMYMVSGLGATMFSISFDAQADNNVTEASMDKSIESLASPQTGSTQYYYKVTSADELDAAFNVIGAEIAYAASNARFVDQMGDSFNLQMTPIVDYDGNAITDAEGNAMMPSIQIISYDIYTRQDFVDGLCTENQIGVRKGTSTVLETVTFTSTKNDDGSYTVTGAYSDKINNGQTNILADGTQAGYVKGVIYAQTFLYNTNVTGVAIDGVSIPTDVKTDGTTTGSTNVLPSETFYWKLGTVQTSELAMRYYVYLDGSMEGTRAAGSYKTNEFAILYYDNYLNNPCHKDTISPSVAWESANVSYAFYLVNENGEIIVNQTTGETGTFANKIAVTNPVVYEEIWLNNTDQVQSIDVAAISDDVLPKYYTLYDEGAIYEIHINSDATGRWEITKGNVTADSTYVTGYTLGTAYSNALTENSEGYDYTHTTVWFAVVWKVSAHPDSVVVDYGLPVNISVLSNDMFGDSGALDSIGAYDATLEDVTAGGTLATGFGKTYTGQFGVATADPDTGKVIYKLNTSNGMQMNSVDKFTYAVYYSGDTNPGYYYDYVTVIPATNIYYEEDFLSYSYTGTGPNGETAWKTEGTAVSGAFQDEDRPGKYSLQDANNIYGYDKINLPVSAYSLGAAKKATIDADSYATAEFTFIGTGCDIVAMTSSDTGVLIAQVYQNGELVTYKTVDTYYGVAWQQLKDKEGNPKLDENGNAAMGWVPVGDAAEGTPDKIYQVPVLKFSELPYGTYTVKLTASYYDALNHMGDGSYDLYIDAIRIYDPAGTQYGTDDGADGITGNLIHSDIQGAYSADGERWPVYYEVRNLLLGQASLSNLETDTKVNGVVFIDGDGSVGDDQLSDYISYGPNNEVYLAPGQRVAFKLNEMDNQNVESVHIGLRSLGGEASYTFVNVAATSNETTGVTAGKYYNPKTEKISTATDMLYDLTAWKDDIIVISNYTTETQTTGCLAITNIKITFKSDPYAVGTTNLDDMLYMTPYMATLSLRSMNSSTIVETPDIQIQEPEVEVPEATEPVVPEVTEPATTAPAVPEATKPETTAPVTPSEPETTEPAVPEQNAPGVDVPNAETPKEDVPAVERPVPDNGPVTETLQQLGFWARLWNAIKNAFEQLFSWFGF